MSADRDEARLSLPVTDRDHTQGSAQAALILVEYGDYECPHCFINGARHDDAWDIETLTEALLAKQQDV